MALSCRFKLGLRGLSQRLSFLSGSLRCQSVPRAFISGKTMRGNEPVPSKPAPFPYKTKSYTYFHLHWDITSRRFDENTKVLVVEGSIAAGKTTLAKALAEELDMLYIPEANLDMDFKNSYGYDLRDYKDEIPDSVKPYDIGDFYRDPHNSYPGVIQMRMYKLRFYQYLDMLMHVFNTGQGVVMDRCVYSDFCFLETMVKHGYISEAAKRYYYEVRKSSIYDLMQPHLVIYLDAPVDILLERIKKRGHEHEQNTKVLTPAYLETLANVYKYQYLKEISKHAELLVYDWSSFGDAETVVEDIERIDFDKFDKYDKKMKDWRFFEEHNYGEKRWAYTRQNWELRNLLNVPILDVPEMLGESDDMEALDEVYYSVPGNKYAAGFNAEMGDKNFLFK